MDKNRNKAISNKTLALYIITITFVFVVYAVFQAQKRMTYSDKNLLEKVESTYNNIFVYKDVAGNTHMVFGYRGRNFVESINNPQDAMELRVPYTRLMGIGVLYADKIQDMLCIGMGGAKASSYLSSYFPALNITEVELDPDVVKLATKYFSFSANDDHKVVVDDGRKFLMHSKNQYDIIMLDAYRGTFVPFHLLTVNFYDEVKKHLKPSGVIVQNIDSSTMLFDSAIATMRKVFDQVEIYPSDGNVVAVAYNGKQKTPEELKAKATALQDQYHFRYSFVDLLKKRDFFTPKPETQPLTDDFAPVDSLKAIDNHNHKWQ